MKELIYFYSISFSRKKEKVTYNYNKHVVEIRSRISHIRPSRRLSTELSVSTYFPFLFLLVSLYRYFEHHLIIDHTSSLFYSLSFFSIHSYSLSLSCFSVGIDFSYFLSLCLYCVLRHTYIHIHIHTHMYMYISLVDFFEKEITLFLSLIQKQDKKSLSHRI